MYLNFEGNPKNCCYDCGRRKVGCHSSCQTYIDWRKREKEKWDRIRVQNEPENYSRKVGAIVNIRAAKYKQKKGV